MNFSTSASFFLFSEHQENPKCCHRRLPHKRPAAPDNDLICSTYKDYKEHLVGMANQGLVGVNPVNNPVQG